MDKKRISILASYVYICIMAIAMLVMSKVFHYSYKDPEMLRIIVYFEVVMTVFSIYIYRKYFKGTAFNKIKKSPILMIFASAIFMTLIVYLLTGNFKNQGSLFYIILATTLLVGISEELMFRGILFSGIESESGTARALIYSSLLFAMLHAVNILGGLSVKETLVQMMMTFFYGLLSGVVRIRSGNILPFMVLHFLWDFMVISNPLVNSSIAIFTLGISFLEVILGIIVLLGVLRKKDK